LGIRNYINWIQSPSHEGQIFGHVDYINKHTTKLNMFPLQQKLIFVQYEVEGKEIFKCLVFDWSACHTIVDGVRFSFFNFVKELQGVQKLMKL
jgi:hypothetical protein